MLVLMAEPGAAVARQSDNMLSFSPVSLSASFTRQHTSALSSLCTLTGYVHQFVSHCSVSVLNCMTGSCLCVPVHLHLMLSLCMCLLQVFTVSVCDVSGSAG